MSMFRDQGFELLEGFVDQDELAPLFEELEDLTIDKGGIRNAEKRYASVNDLVYSPKLMQKATDYLGGQVSVARVILFDKNPDANWLVTWHQDKTVAVSRQHDSPGWNAWSIKDETHHAHPPEEVMNDTVTFRVHLDQATEANGCLKVIPGSHQDGFLDQAVVSQIAQYSEPVFCEANAGDVLVMSPLLLHASSKAVEPRPRRILHIEYSSYPLPSGVCWA